MRDRSAVSSSSTAAKLAEAGSKEFFWGCELTKGKPEIQWTFEEEDDDHDFLQHTLFMRHAVLGAGVPEGERQVVEIETVNFAGDTVKQPLISMTAGKMDMCQLDLNFGHELPVHFRLVEGSGPVFLSAQQLVEFPQEVDGDYTETEYTEDEEEDLEALEEEEEEEEKAGDEAAKAKKRKRGKLDPAKKKRGKMDSEANGASEEDDESMEEETEGTEENGSDEDASEEEYEEEESDEDTPKKKGKKPTKVEKPKATKKPVKAVKAVPPKKASAKKAKAK